jgi:purine catabolism regulator
MHTSSEQTDESFEVTIDHAPAQLCDLFPGLDEHDRIGLVVSSPHGALGASLLYLAAVHAFYELCRRESPDFWIYPDFFFFHVGRRHGYHGSLDVWPDHKEVLVEADGDHLLEAINDRAITRLALPDHLDIGRPARREGLASYERRTRGAFIYSSPGRATGANVSIRGDDTTARYVGDVLDPCSSIARLRPDYEDVATVIEAHLGEVSQDTRSQIRRARQALVIDAERARLIGESPQKAPSSISTWHQPSKPALLRSWPARKDRLKVSAVREAVGQVLPCHRAQVVLGLHCAFGGYSPSSLADNTMKAPDTQRGGTAGGIRVADLVGMAHLGLKVLARAEGLDRRVAWTHISELQDPGPWLDGGEMLIANGFGVPKTGRSQAQYVSRLAENRAVALALGVRTPPLRREMFKAADALNFPILRIPQEVPFVAISHLVANANQHAAQRRLVRHLQILDTLRLREGKRASSKELFAELEEISGYRLALVSAAGNPVLPEWPWAPEQIDVSALREYDEARVKIDGGYVLPVPVEKRIAAFLIAFERSDQEPAGVSALRHIATVAALEVVEAYRQREAQRRSGAEALAELLAGQVTAEGAASRLEAEGFGRGEHLVLAAFRSSDRELDDDDLFHRLNDRGVRHLMLRQDELYVLMADPPGLLEGLVGDLDLIVGVSSTIENPARLALARRQVLWSLARAGSSADRRIARFGATDGFAHWLPTDLGALRQIVNATLGPIVDYDATHDTELLRTLVTFFRNQRKLTAAASELFVHKHTLAYRLNRIEEITGRDLNDLQDTSELWLALKALPVVRGSDDDREL